MNGNEPLDIKAIAQARVGQTLKGKWRLGRLLGMGGMAAVYAARHRNGSQVAIKVLHPELNVHPTLRARFLREGYAANSVEHRGAVRVLDDDTAEDGAVFLVMELLEGEPLDARRHGAGGTLPVSQVLSITDQLLDVLAAAHAKGIIHRDIKPQNIFLTSDGVLKVLDFGIAHLRDSTTGDTVMTRTGTSMGSPGFMPPEQARGRWELVDAQSDLWAVGATMFRVLTGKRVHSAATVNEALLLAMTQAAPPIGTFLPDLSPLVAALVDRALAFDKADRWPNARVMQAAVRDVAQAASAVAHETLLPVLPPTTAAPSAVAGSGAVAPMPASPQPSVLDMTAEKTTQRRPFIPVSGPAIAEEAQEPPRTVSGVSSAATEIALPKARPSSRGVLLAAGVLVVVLGGSLFAAQALQGHGGEAQLDAEGERNAALSASTAALAGAPMSSTEATGDPTPPTEVTTEPTATVAPVPDATGSPAPPPKEGSDPPRSSAVAASSVAPATSAAPSNTASSIPSRPPRSAPVAPSTPPKPTGSTASPPPSPKPSQDVKDKWD